MLYEVITVAFVIFPQGPGNAVPAGACLTGNPAALDVDENVELGQGVGNVQGLLDHVDVAGVGKVFIHIPAVDHDLSASRPEVNPRHGSFSPACS